MGHLVGLRGLQRPVRGYSFDRSRKEGLRLRTQPTIHLLESGVNALSLVPNEVRGCYGRRPVLRSDAVDIDFAAFLCLTRDEVHGIGQDKGEIGVVLSDRIDQADDYVFAVFRDVLCPHATERDHDIRSGVHGRREAGDVAEMHSFYIHVGGVVVRTGLEIVGREGGDAHTAVVVEKSEDRNVVQGSTIYQSCWGGYQVTYGLQRSGSKWMVSTASVTQDGSSCTFASAPTPTPIPTQSNSTQALYDAVVNYHTDMRNAYGPNHDLSDITNTATGTALAAVECQTSHLITENAYKTYELTDFQWVSGADNGANGTVVQNRHDINTVHYANAPDARSDDTYTATFQLVNNGGLVAGLRLLMDGGLADGWGISGRSGSLLTVVGRLRT